MPNELYIKYFVVNFTVVGAYAHLMHLRHERRELSFLLILALPIAGAALVAVPMIALFAQIVICAGDGEMLSQSVGILIGRIRDEQPAHSDNENDEIFTWPPKISTELIRNLLVQAAILTQSIMSVWLFARRVKHDADALYDHRILQLAVLGICASAMSIVHIILRPRCPSDDDMNRIPRRVQWLRLLRPITDSESVYAYFWPNRDEVIGQREDQNDGEVTRTPFELPLLFVDWIYTSVALSLAMAMGLRGEGLVSWQTILELTLSSLTHLYYLLIIPLAIDIVFRGFLVRQTRQFLRGFAFVQFVGLICLPLLFLFTGLALEVFLYRPFWTIGQVWTLFGKPWGWQEIGDAVDNDWVRYYIDWDSIWTYGHAPSTFACPEAWKDPAADYVWWLA